MERELQFPRSIALDRDYWLSRCEGFRVESRGRRIGIVEEVRYRSRHDRPDSVVVCGGLFGTRRLVVPIEEVEAIVPSRLQLVVRVRPPEAKETMSRHGWRAIKRWRTAASAR